MVDEVCKKVGTRWLPPREKRDEDDIDAHPKPSIITEKNHDPNKSTTDQEEDPSLEENK